MASSALSTLLVLQRIAREPPPRTSMRYATADSPSLRLLSASSSASLLATAGCASLNVRERSAGTERRSIPPRSSRLRGPGVRDDGTGGRGDDREVRARPLARVLIVADSGNGISSVASPFEYLFINTELTVHLFRQPVGEWVCLDAVSRIDRSGVGVAESIIWDEVGRIGRGNQALLVAPRSERTS